MRTGPFVPPSGKPTGLRVAIVGGGLSGTLACLQLLREVPGVRISLHERRPHQLNRGVAYSSRLSRQLLNVPADRMGLFPNDREGFLRWARNGPLPHAHPGDFLSRSLFGDHVHDMFHTELDRYPGQVRIIAGEAVSLDHRPVHGYRLRLSDGAWSDHDAVVLALGNAPPAHVPHMAPAARRDPHYVEWPWRPGAMAAIGIHDEVLFVGAGLTMVDLLLTLDQHGHQGAVTVLSRHGLLPREHAVSPPWPLPPIGTSQGPRELNALLRQVRREVELARQAGVPWQGVMDAVKLQARSIWQALPIAERERFMRHLRPYWEAHRHRMPGSARERIEELRAQGRLRPIAARIMGVVEAQNGFTVDYQPRGMTSTERSHTRWIINCSGPQADTRRLEQPLLLDLLSKGLASWDELHLGLRTTVEGALLDAQAQVVQGLYAIGPPCKAALWECTAVPEIRDQAVVLAKLMHNKWERRPKGVRRTLFDLLDHLAWPSA